MSLRAPLALALVGAGPHALTLAMHLLGKKSGMRGRFLAFDPSGTWLSQWKHQFAALAIPHLRSPAVHHPDPNPFALRAFAESRPNELYPPYHLPGTRLFEDFCEDAIHRWGLERSVYPARVLRIVPRKVHRRWRFGLELSDGETAIARRVVLASGGGVPHQPDWASKIPSDYPPQRLLHSDAIDLRGLRLEGERVLIIGGGLTSGHLALGAMERGAKVLLMSRRRLSEKLFDAEPGWLGPKYLKDFWAEPEALARWQMIQQARDGGSMTPEVLTQLRRSHREGRLVFYEKCQVAEAVWKGDSWQVHCDNRAVCEPPSRIWLATGRQFDAGKEPLLAEVLESYPNEIVKGLPVLDEHLRWPGCELFLMGAWAGLQVGPTARNLFGARAASDRIVPALTKASLALH